MAFHDPILDRVTESSGVIAKMPWHEVRQASVGGEPIPTLDDVLDAFRESFINIDIKHDAATMPLIEVLSRHQAKEQGYDVKVSRFPFSANGKAWGMGDGSGFVKVVADARHNELLGATIIGHDVSELIPALTVAQMWDITTDEVARNIFPHPSLSEALKDAVEGIGGEMINI